MLMLSLLETIDQLAMASRVWWYDLVLRRENGHALRCALEFVCFAMPCYSESCSPL